MTFDRILALQGVHNFRDYGGYAAANGARIKTGLLWRSAQHSEASEADLAAINALDLAAVVDLRGPSERVAHPCRRHEEFSAQVFNYPDETAGLALHTEAADGVATAAEAKAAMIRLYAGISSRENLIPMLRCHFMVLARGEGANLIHCVAGKDRTGFGVALVHHALGVHPDDIMADYLLTNVAGNIEARIAVGTAMIQSRYGAMDDHAVRALWGVDASYLDTAFSAIRTEHGTLDRYLAEVLGIGAAERDQLHRLYLA